MSGRRKGTTYKCRTNAERQRDDEKKRKREKDAEDEEKKRLAARRNTFFQPRGDDITQQQQEEEAKEAGGGGAIRDGGDGGDDDGGDDDDDGDDFGDNEDDDAMPPADDEDDEAANDEDHAGQPATAAEAPRRNPNQNAARRNRADREPTLEDPLPGVNMSNTPQMFRLGIGKIMHELRKKLQGRTKQSNQHQRHTTGSGVFPWTDFERQWPVPALLHGRAPDTVDFMHPHFARVKFFALDHTAPHLLPSGCTPCKWHGFADDPDTGVTCSCRDLFCNNFVRQFEDVDGSVGFLFSTRHCCSRLKPKNAEESSGGMDDIDDHPCHFANHDPMSLAHLDPELRDVFGLVLTKQRRITVPLLDSIFEDAVRGMSFQSANNKMTTLQNNAFCEKKGIPGTTQQSKSTANHSWQSHKRKT